LGEVRPAGAVGAPDAGTHVVIDELDLTLEQHLLGEEPDGVLFRSERARSVGPHLVVDSVSGSPLLGDVAVRGGAVAELDSLATGGAALNLVPEEVALVVRGVQVGTLHHRNPGEHPVGNILGAALNEGDADVRQEGINVNLSCSGVRHLVSMSPVPGAPRRSSSRSGPSRGSRRGSAGAPG